VAANLSPAALRRRLLTLARPILPPLGVSIAWRIIGLAAGIALLGVAGSAVVGAATTLRLSSLYPPVLPTGWISSIIWALVALSLVKGLARYLEQYFGHYVAFRALASLRLYFYDKLAPQAPAAVEGRDTGDLLARVTKDVDRVEVFFAHTIAPAVTAVIVPLGTLIYMGLAVSPWAVPPLAAGLIVVGLVTPAVRRASSAHASREIRAARGAITSHVRDSVQGVREVLAFDYRDRRLAELGALDQPLGRALRSLGDTIALRRSINVALIGLVLLAQLIVLTAAGVFSAELGLGLGITAAAFAPVTAVEDFAADLQQAYASARRIFEVTDAVPLVPDHPTASPGPGQANKGLGGDAAASGKGAVPGDEPEAGGAGPEVRFENVTFCYPGAARSAPALQDVTLTAAAGKVTAVVGASGSGKSTLAALLTRSWDPTAGQITLGGRPIDSWSLAELRDLVAVSPQRPYLFNQSIRDNLMLARPDATDGQLAWAAQAAHLDQVIATKEDGWDAPVGELGELLSGGERQRLALARTLLREPAVLVVDEATSQLDQAAEAEVLAGIDAASQGRTVLVIAHRLATIRSADAIYVMDAGRVVQHGTYSVLAAQAGPFADLAAREDNHRAPNLAL
jgi:thiol reductant ABC exporter CydC subunit